MAQAVDARPRGRLRQLVGRWTTPLLPDDYTKLVHPLWSARELRGRVEQVRPETADSATLVIRPGWGWSFDHQPGQYVGIGVQLDGRWHWRSYSLTCPPQTSDGLITVTVKAMPEGFLSAHLVRGLHPGTLLRLAAPRGRFVLPDPPPPRLLFWTGGSGITPVIAMLRTLDGRGSMPDVLLVHSAPSQDQVIFGAELRRLADRNPGLRLHQNLDDRDGRFHPARFDQLCPDWRARQAWVCGPPGMLAAAEKFWRSAGLADALHVERFQPVEPAGDGRTGGRVRFRSSGRELAVDGATTLLQAGEQAGLSLPFGCRMGICHTCVVRLVSGRVRDLRDGTDHTGTGQLVQTCVSAPAGDCELDI